MIYVSFLFLRLFALSCRPEPGIASDRTQEKMMQVIFEGL